MKFRLILALTLIAVLSLLTDATAIAAVPLNWSVSNAFGDNSGCNSTTLQCQTIQAAVTNATAGDYVFIAPGTYVEQVTVGKNITIIGSGAGSSMIQAPGTMTADSVGKRPIIEINNGATVTLAGVTVNGPGPTSGGFLDFGIYVIGNATINLVGSTIDNIRDNPLNGGQHGVGIQVGQQSVSQAGHATIANVVVTNYQKNGITVGGTGSSGTVKNSTTTGAGPTAPIAQNGIQISDGAVGTVYGNTVSGNQCKAATSGGPPSCGPDWVTQEQSTGILLFNAGAGTTVVGNTTSSNDIGIGISSGTGIVSSNTMTGNRYYGAVIASASSSMVSNNTITGPSNFGLAVDGSTGKAFGNTITGNSTGVVWYSISGAPPMAVNDNVISGNSSHGASNTVSPFADAKQNWWGSAAGPGVGGNNNVIGNVNVSPFAVAQVGSVSHSTHEVGENATFDTNVTVSGLYGVQFVLDHTTGILTFQSGVTHNAGTPPTDWDWTKTFFAKNFAPNTPSAGQTELAATLRSDLHPSAANLIGGNLATWTYQCAGVGISPLVYDATAATGTILSDKNGFPIAASLIGDSVNCVAVTADSTQGVIAMQGRVAGAATPAGWNGAVVTLTCTGGACLGYGPYTFAATDVNGNYAIIKAGAGTGVATGTYLATVSRRAYLSAAQIGLTVTSGSNTLTTPTLLGGEVTGDGYIGIGDLTLIGGAFGNTVPADTGADVNGDSVVNILDLVLAGGNYGLSAPQPW